MASNQESIARLRPIYRTDSPGTDVLLVEGLSAALCQDGLRTTGTLSLRQLWSPPRILWEFTADQLPAFRFDTVTLEADSFSFDGQLWRTSHNQRSGYVTSQITHLAPCRHSHLTFHLTTYYDVAHRNIDYRHRETVSGPDGEELNHEWSSIVLNGHGWEITLQPYQDIHWSRRASKEQQRIVLSGIGQLRRNDHSGFTFSDATNILNALRVFMSFAMGQWMRPLLIVGHPQPTAIPYALNHSDELLPFLDHPRGWASEYDGEWLSNAFPIFLERWLDDRWTEPLEQAVTWLIRSLHVPRDAQAAIAFAQIALELLAIVVYVNDNPSEDENRYDRKYADVKLTNLLNSCGIPTTVPSHLPGLVRISDTEAELRTGPTIVTHIRNKLLHPTSSNRSELQRLASKCGSAEEMFLQTHQLMRWYITLVILKIINWSGQYVDRTKLGHPTERVPWSA